ncbi:hypothetical protein BV898_18363 [Hypsibius exemplaris]|uniref:Receptor ligand binding region domain-containing protein n=1 Tax=Hypsibius exemplaris TaxID=2072580 RepID=A0A9X6NIP2_HYPEX|nr:hypothetical protein BV898_18363 [Hypsibius exemplaris]
MINVTFVTIVASSYFLVVPGYEAGIEYVRQSATNVAFQYVVIHNRSIPTCEMMANHHTHLAAEYFYTRRQLGSFTIFIAPYCSQGELLDFAPLANQWNAPVMSIAGTNPSISDKSQYPTNLSVAPIHHTVLHMFLEQLFRHFKWTTIVLLCDDKHACHVSAGRNGMSGNDYTAMLFRSAKRQLNVSRPEGVVWQGGTVPLNEPVCGFTGKNPVCQPSGISRTSLILAALGGLAALALMIGLGTRIVLRHLIDQTSEKWWQLTNVNVRFENWPTGTPMDDGSIEADATDENDSKSFPRWQPVLY